MSSSRRYAVVMATLTAFALLACADANGGTDAA